MNVTRRDLLHLVPGFLIPASLIPKSVHAFDPPATSVPVTFEAWKQGTIHILRHAFEQGLPSSSIEIIRRSKYLAALTEATDVFEGRNENSVVKQEFWKENTVDSVADAMMFLTEHGCKIKRFRRKDRYITEIRLEDWFYCFNHDIEKAKLCMIDHETYCHAYMIPAAQALHANVYGA